MTPSNPPQLRPPQAVLVTSEHELIKAFTAARLQNLRLQVTGCGDDLGLGSMDPLSDDTVLLDLSGMSRIEDFDPEFGHLTVEPGVTFAQLHAFLRERDAAWFLPSIAGPSDASVLRDFLEQGHWGGPHFGRTSSIVKLVAILSTGEALELSEAAGPELRGLLLRSTLGVVTRLRLKLTAKPAQLQIVTAAFDEATGAIDGTLELRKHLLQGSLGPNVMTVWYRTRLDLFNGTRGAMASQPPWLLTVALFAASPRHAELGRDTLLRTLPKARCLHEDQVPVDVRAAFLGGPSMVRMDALPTGQVWIRPALPFTRRALETAVKILDEMNHRVWPLSARFHVDDPSSIHIFIGLHFDLASTPEERVRWVVDTVLREFETAGIPCSPCSALKPADKEDAPGWRQRLQQALDPSGLLVPRRHGPL